MSAEPGQHLIWQRGREVRRNQVRQRGAWRSSSAGKGLAVGMKVGRWTKVGLCPIFRNRLMTLVGVFQHIRSRVDWTRTCTVLALQTSLLFVTARALCLFHLRGYSKTAYPSAWDRLPFSCGRGLLSCLEGMPGRG